MRTEQYDELIRKINKRCLMVGCYDYFLLKEIVSSFCRQNRIKINSPDWIYLVDTLWCELETFVRYDFDDIGEFDAWLSDYFV